VPLMPCPDCGREVSTAAQACPQCGCPLTNIAALAHPPAPPVRRGRGVPNLKAYSDCGSEWTAALDSETCPDCGGDLSEVDPNAPPPPMEDYEAPAGAIVATAALVPVVGVPWAIGRAVRGKRCPKCRMKLHKGDATCPQCGRENP
jgi:predicted amidophosphoribosyltransferase